MSNFAMFDYYDCDIYKPEDFFPRVDSREAFFSIEFFSRNPNCVLMHKKLDVLQKHVLRESSVCWSTISRKLSELNVPYPAHPSVIHRIIDYARSAVNGDHNVDCEIIPLVVIIRAVSSDNVSEEAAISEAVTRSIDSQVLNFVPASESSIEALQKFKVEGSSKQCVICLEEIAVGSEAMRTPCFHGYHQDCIVNWLKNGNLCPLCRFQLPC